jgi:hypothetical protein
LGFPRMSAAVELSPNATNGCRIHFHTFISTATAEPRRLLRVWETVRFRGGRAPHAAPLRCGRGGCASRRARAENQAHYIYNLQKSDQFCGRQRTPNIRLSEWMRNG